MTSATCRLSALAIVSITRTPSGIEKISDSETVMPGCAPVGAAGACDQAAAGAKSAASMAPIVIRTEKFGVKSMRPTIIGMRSARIKAKQR